MTFTGLDRLLCVLYPNFPKKVKPVPYLGVIILVCVFFSTRNLLNFYETAAAEFPFFMITGTIGDIMMGNASQYLLCINMIFNSITIVLYVVVGFVIRKKSASNSSTADQRNRRIFRSLCIIIFVNVFGYYLCAAYMFFVRPILANYDPIWCWTVTMFVGILGVNVNAASNGPVLYATSQEYRKAFRHEFGRIRRCFFRFTSYNASALQIHPLPIVVQSVSAGVNRFSSTKHCYGIPPAK